MTTWNILDWPTMILPTTFVKPTDVKDASYKPVSDLDQETYDLYSPELFEGAPVSLQLIGRSMLEEQLLATSIAVDNVINKA